MEKRFGVMLDMSRNGVMKPGQVKKFATVLKSFGYNMIQLYTEDTYEIPGEPYFGYMRGRYTQEELKDIVNYCEGMGMEVIPCIQTLAHLRTIFKWSVYQEIQDVNDILLAEHERTYALIDKMFASLRACFTTEYVHIGMDEAHMLGLGKYLDKYGAKNRFEILRAHLEKVIALAKKYNFKPIMWSDMFFRLGNDGVYSLENPVITDEAIHAVPEGVGLVYWDYYQHGREIYDGMFKAHEKLGRETWFAAGAWTWLGFAPGNKKAMETSIHGMRSAAEHGVENVMVTVWGDNGKECSYFSVLPALFAAKRFYDGCTDMSVIKDEFQAVTGEDFDKFCALDKPNLIGGNTLCTQNASKVMFYSDPFNGFLDSTVPATNTIAAEYERIALELSEYAKKSAYGYIFETESLLCKFLAIKYELGLRTRAAYQAKDKKALKALIGDYAKAEKRLKAFYNAFAKLWYIEHKPQGLEVIELRIGGMLLRLKACRKRLKACVQGKAEIPELDDTLLDFYGGGTEFRREIPCLIDWAYLASVNNIIV